MNFQDFKESTNNILPPQNLPVYLAALWWDLKGDWAKAHNLVDSLDDATSCRVHAYLHRKEGDDWNADYWYRRAGKKRPEATLAEEWESLVKALL